MKGERSKGSRILVVDEAKTTRERVCAMLAEVEGVEVVGCSPQPEAIMPRLEASRPDCVVIDVPARGPEGFELLREVRERAPQCKLIVLTNHVSDEFRLRSEGAGADHFLSKAHEFEKLIDLVRALEQSK